MNNISTQECSPQALHAREHRCQAPLGSWQPCWFLPWWHSRIPPQRSCNNTFQWEKKWRHDSNNICGGTYFFALYSRRTLLSSTVWGNEPIVVVGRTGRLSFFCWASNLAETLVARRWSEPFKAAACKKCISGLELMCTNIQKKHSLSKALLLTTFWTSSFVTLGDDFLEARAATLAAK